MKTEGVTCDSYLHDGKCAIALLAGIIQATCTIIQEALRSVSVHFSAHEFYFVGCLDI